MAHGDAVRLHDDALHLEVRAAVRRLGIVRAAVAAGVSHQTLRKFVGGGRVRAGTREKLGAWLDARAP
jgi:hypothetical protein